LIQHFMIKQFVKGRMYVFVYDTAVLLSGDSDFAYILRRIKSKGKRVIVMSTRGHIALELIKEAKFIDLRKLKNEVSL